MAGSHTKIVERDLTNVIKKYQYQISEEKCRLFAASSKTEGKVGDEKTKILANSSPENIFENYFDFVMKSQILEEYFYLLSLAMHNCYSNGAPGAVVVMIADALNEKEKQGHKKAIENLKLNDIHSEARSFWSMELFRVFSSVPDEAEAGYRPGKSS